MLAIFKMMLRPDKMIQIAYRMNCCTTTFPFYSKLMLLQNGGTHPLLSLQNTLRAVGVKHACLQNARPQPHFKDGQHKFITKWKPYSGLQAHHFRKETSTGIQLKQTVAWKLQKFRLPCSMMWQIVLVVMDGHGVVKAWPDFQMWGQSSPFRS